MRRLLALQAASIPASLVVTIGFASALQGAVVGANGYTIATLATLGILSPLIVGAVYSFRTTAQTYALWREAGTASRMTASIGALASAVLAVGTLGLYAWFGLALMFGLAASATG